MAKKQPSKRQKKQAPSKDTFLNKYLNDILLMLLIFVAVFGFLHEAVFGFGFTSSDAISFRSFDPFQDLAEEKGTFPLWIPYIFSGMPAVMVSYGERAWDLVAQFYFAIPEMFRAIFGNRSALLATHYGVYGIGVYLLMRFKEHSKFVSFFTAFAAVFSTSVVAWMFKGHNSKIVAFSMLPYIFMLIEMLRIRFTLLKLTGLMVVLHIMFASNHIQIIYYSLIAYILYFLFEIIARTMQKQKIKSLIYSGIGLAAAGIIAFSMYADRYFSILEYTPHSTRGKGPIVQTDDTQRTKGGGNSYDYATGWSFSPEEIATFFVPNYFGFGKLEYSGPETRGQEVKVPTYWGQKAFEDEASYMGIAVLVFAIIGIILYRRNPFVLFLAVMSLFALIMSFGKNLSFLYDLFYYNAPMFNKFRVPSMILLLVQFSVPILAGYGLTGMLKWRNDLPDKGKKILNGALGFSLAFLVLGFLYSLFFKDAYISAVAASNTGQRLPETLHSFIYESMIGDWYATAFILILSVLSVYLYVRNKINKVVFVLALGLLLVIDMWRVSYRPMEVAEQPMKDQTFRQTDVIRFLKQDESNFRIAHLGTQSQNVPAYYLLQNVGGYSAAKLRVYQDMLDVADQSSTSVVTNPFLWNLLNVKYVVAEGNTRTGLEPVFQSKVTGNVVYRNQYRLPRTFFVDTVETEEGLEILKKMKDGRFIPTKVAFLEEPLDQSIEAPDSTASSEMVEFDNEYIKIKANASGNNFMFISEIYYPYWSAFIDGEEVSIHKTNFAFRGIVVPEGEHTIELKFHSPAFSWGKSLSIAGNIIVFLSLILGVYFNNKKKKKK